MREKDTDLYVCKTYRAGIRSLAQVLAGVQEGDGSFGALEQHRMRLDVVPSSPGRGMMGREHVDPPHCTAYVGPNETVPSSSGVVCSPCLLPLLMTSPKFLLIFQIHLLPQKLLFKLSLKTNIFLKNIFQDTYHIRYFILVISQYDCFIFPGQIVIALGKDYASFVHLFF